MTICRKSTIDTTTKWRFHSEATEKPTSARAELRARLTKQLKASEFRFLNEKLYRADNSNKVLDAESAAIYHEANEFSFRYIVC